MGTLLEYEKAQRLLSRYKIKSVDSGYVKSAEEAIKFAKGKPIVLKAISQKALHKSKSGLIKLNLYTDKQIAEAFKDLSRRAAKFKPYKVLAQKMVTGSVEIIIGGKVDQQFGKMVLLGLGGIYVETFKDFALRACPITKYDALSMINQLKSKKVIAPDAQSQERVAALLLKASKMFEENKMEELDLNPIILHDNTYDAVDLRVLQ